jgi:RecB family exonuclease
MSRANGSGGRAAIERLAVLIRDGGRPAYVACPTTTVALHARRETGRLLGGLFDVRFGTLARFAGERGGARLGKPLLPQALEPEAARAALHQAPGPWSPWAGHTGAAQELLRRLPGWDPGRLPPALRALHDAWRETIREFATTEDRLLSAAEGAVGAPEAAPWLTLYALTALTPAQAALVEAYRGIGKLTEVPLGHSGPPPATVVAAPEPEDEARAAVRWAVSHLAGGAPCRRLGVLYPTESPYGELMRELLEAAGVPASGGPRRRLSATRAGATLLGALNWAAGPPEAAALISWLPGGSGWTPEMAAQARRAGAFGDLDRFLLRLGDGELARHISQVADSLKPPLTGWRQALGWLREWAHERIEPTKDPDETHLEHALLMLERTAGTLDSWSPNPGPGDLARMAGHALAATVPDATPYGEGVYLGRLEASAGLEFDAVWVLGLTESALPPGPALDPFWPEAPAEDRASAAWRAYDAALACAPSVTLSYPRGERSTGRELAPSPWLPDHAARREVASFYAALRDGPPASAQEATLQGLLAGGPPPPELEPAFRAIAARRSGEFTAYDGALGRLPGVTWSPTSLETLAACPMRYALRHVWRVDPQETEAQESGWSALRRGQLIHRALEAFFASRHGRDPDEPWRPEDRAALRSLAADLLDAEATRGFVTPGPDWDATRAGALRLLDAFLDDDEDWRREACAVPTRTEEAIRAAAELRAGDTVIRFSGRADRIDETPEGLVVFDYKCRAAKPSRPKDGLGGGLALQLPLYMQAYGAQRAANWWLLHDGAPDRDPPIAWSETLESGLAEWVAVLDRMAQEGRFPARPGQDRGHGHENCRICPYDRVCPADRAAAWRRKRGSPEIAAYAARFESGEEEA